MQTTKPQAPALPARPIRTIEGERAPIGLAVFATIWTVVSSLALLAAGFAINVLSGFRSVAPGEPVPPAPHQPVATAMFVVGLLGLILPIIALSTRRSIIAKICACVIALPAIGLCFSLDPLTILLAFPLFVGPALLWYQVARSWSPQAQVARNRIAERRSARRRTALAQT